jgi:hypothetical protein
VAYGDLFVAEFARTRSDSFARLNPGEFNDFPLSLPLLVPGVGANDVHPALAAHDLAILANPFDAGSDFHGNVRPAGALWLNSGKATQYSRLSQNGSRPRLG